MEIKSPIGEMPFEVVEVRMGRGGLELHGAMGAWPTEVSIPWSELPVLAQRTLRPALPYLSAAAISVAALAIARRR
jgi:hypothetical protein